MCSGIFCPPGNVVDVAAGLLRRPRNDLRRGINDLERRLLCKVWEKFFCAKILFIIDTNIMELY